MNLEQVNKLSDKEINYKMMEVCGFSKIEPIDWGVEDSSLIGIHDYRGWNDKIGWDLIPIYTENLNACHELWINLTYLEQVYYMDNLGLVICGPNKNDWLWCDIVNSTAIQRCKAYILTMTE